MADGAPVWVLLGQRTGDNNQLLRLAAELGLPFRSLHLRYNWLHLLPPDIVGKSLATLAPQSRSLIRPPWPELVLGIGYRSVPVALAIRKLSGGKARLVRLGNPRRHPRHFDLLMTTAQYDVPEAANVIRLQLGISTAPPAEPTREEREWLAKLPRPHRLLLIGGDTFMWKLKPEIVAAAAESLGSRAAAEGGSTIAVSSGRSSANLRDATAAALAESEHGLVWGGFPRYPVLLDDADEIHVTADSVAMISDAVATGKPVGLVLPEPSLGGRIFYKLKKLGLRVPVRDIRRFWQNIERNGLAGTIERPVAADVRENSVATAITAVRNLLER